MIKLLFETDLTFERIKKKTFFFFIASPDKFSSSVHCAFNFFNCMYARAFGETQVLPICLLSPPSKIYIFF
jgi:hypothetical protein